jgi:predicted  nucleic acid-binding Zn-ribbon protein
VTALENDVVKEKEFSEELQMQLEALEAIKRVLESEVESAHQDARKLHEKVEFFEAKLKEQMSSVDHVSISIEHYITNVWILIYEERRCA